MLDTTIKLAVVTGASTGIGLELARICAKNGFSLIIAANEPEIEDAANELRREGTVVETVQADLATIEGNEELYMKIAGRPVAALACKRRQGTWQRLPRSRFPRCALCRRYKYNRDDLPDPKDRTRHARPRAMVGS